LFSSSSLKYHPDNTLTKFTIEYEDSIKLDKNFDWEVGVESVAHAAIKFSPENFRIKFFLNTYTTRPDLISKCLINVDLNKYIRESNFFGSLLQSNKKSDPGNIPYCIRDIHNKIMKSTMDENDAMINIFHNPESEKVNFATTLFFNGDGEAEVEVDYPADFDMKIFVKSDTWYNFYDRIIFENVIDKKNLIKHFQSIEPEENQSDNQQYFTINVANTDKLKAYFMCVYTDIIKPHCVVGNVSTRMLVMRKIQNHNKHQEWHVNEIRYYPVESRTISNIKILITDHHGEEIDFEDSDFATVVNLRFRKKSCLYRNQTISYQNGSRRV
jgi:hypothetical protein